MFCGRIAKDVPKHRVRAEHVRISTVPTTAIDLITEPAPTTRTRGYPRPDRALCCSQRCCTDYSLPCRAFGGRNCCYDKEATVRSGDQATALRYTASRRLATVLRHECY